MYDIFELKLIAFMENIKRLISSKSPGGILNSHQGSLVLQTRKLELAAIAFR